MALTRLVIELGLIDGASAGVRALTSHLRGMGTEGEAAAKKLSGALTDLEAGLKALSAAKALKESLVDPGLDAARQLEQALASLEVSLDRGSVSEIERQLADVERNAARIAGPTKFDQAQAVGIHTDLARAGLGLPDILGQGGAAEAVTMLASAEGLDAQAAIAAVTTMGSIFGLGGAQYAGAADMLARAGAASNTNAAQLREALAQAPAAGALGLEPRETLGGLGVMANMGIQGGAAGTALNAFLRSSAQQDQRMRLGMYGADGRFVGLGAAAERLRDRTAGMSDVEVQRFITKAFGDEGARFALALLKADKGGLEEVLAAMERSRSLDEKVARLSQTLGAREEAVGGTATTLLATAFKPALQPLSALAQQVNDVLGQVNDRVAGDPRLAQAVSFGALGTVAAAGTYGAARVLRGGVRGLGALGSLGGLGGRAASLAEAKAMEAAAGVTPVAVTNWPAGFSGLGGMAGAAVPAAAAGRLATAGPVIGAALTGGAIGTALNAQIQRSETATTAVQGVLAQMALYTPTGRSAAELYDVATGEDLVGELRRTRGQAINLVVNVDQAGRVQTEDGGAGVLGRVLARLGGA